MAPMSFLHAIEATAKLEEVFEEIVTLLHSKVSVCFISQSVISKMCSSIVSISLRCQPSTYVERDEAVRA